MQSKKNNKSICLNLSIEEYQILEDKAKRRKLDKTNYIRYLINSDQDDLYSVKADRALQQISAGAENLADICNMNKLDQNEILENCDAIIKGVKTLWRCL